MQMNCWNIIQKSNSQPSNKSSKFFIKLSHCDQTQAEDELKREMQIIGQFNEAFIIAGLHDDVFIMNQHANNERF